MSDHLSDNKPALLVLAEELAGISLLEKGTVNPFFLLATDKDAYHVEVDFADQQQKQFTTVKVAAFIQTLSCDHYVFVTRIQFPASAGDKEVMKQQVLIAFAEKTSSAYKCFANLYDMKLNEQLGRPQLRFQQRIDNFDGQFSNLFEAPDIPLDLMATLLRDLDQYKYTQKTD